MIAGATSAGVIQLESFSYRSCPLQNAFKKDPSE